MHDFFMEKMQELHTWRPPTLGWAKCVVAQPTQILGAWAMAHKARPVPPLWLVHMQRVSDRCNNIAYLDHKDLT